MRLNSLVLALALVTMALACSNCLSSSSPAQSATLPAPTVALTEEQKEKAISIAQNDSVVSDKIDGIVGFLHLHSQANQSHYHVKDVVMSSFIDTSPGSNNTTYRMPAVIFIVGNESEDGVDVHVLVDLEKGRVAFIGYTHRPGLADGRFNFSAFVGGVRDGISRLEFYNMTIVDTGYPYYNQSELTAFYPKIANVTLADPGVKSEIAGHSYSVDFGVYGREYFLNGYLERYPTVSLAVNDAETGRPAKMIMASVDLKTNRVMKYIVYSVGEHPDFDCLFPDSSKLY